MISSRRYSYTGSRADEGLAGRRCTTSGTRRRPRPSRGASTRAAWRSCGRCRRWCGAGAAAAASRRSASSRAGARRPRVAAMCSAQPSPPAKPGRLRKMQASSTSRGRRCRRRRRVRGSPCASPLRGTATAAAAAARRLRRRSGDVVVVDEVGAVAAAPLVQLRGVGASSTPWQPAPKMHVQLLRRNVASNTHVRVRRGSSKLIHSCTSSDRAHLAATLQQSRARRHGERQERYR